MIEGSKDLEIAQKYINRLLKEYKNSGRTFETVKAVGDLCNLLLTCVYHGVNKKCAHLITVSDGSMTSVTYTRNVDIASIYGLAKQTEKVTYEEMEAEHLKEK